MKNQQNHNGKFKVHHLVALTGIGLLIYMFAKIKVQILVFKLIEGIIAASMIHNNGYVILFSTVLIFTLFVIYGIVKWMVFEVIFPIITIVDQKNNKMHFKRAIFPIKENGILKGWYVKFRWHPITEFHKFILNGSNFERKIKSIYVYAENMEWDENNNVFKPSDSYIPAHFENIMNYRYMLDEINEMIGQEVGEAVAGDPYVRKDKFEEGLPNPKRDKIWKKEEA